MKRRDFVEALGALALAAGSGAASAGKLSSGLAEELHSQQAHAQEFDPVERSIAELSRAQADGRASAESLTQSYLQRIDRYDRRGPKLGAVLAVNPEALVAARALDAARRGGKSLGPLHGIPLLIKDNIETRDPLPTTAGSLALASARHAEDAPVAARLRSAGAVVIGKANLSEWANFRSSRSVSGWSGVGGQTRCPYDPTRNPSGSSAGPAAGTAANLCAASVGSETDGSVLAPASINGLVGVKPTVGLVSGVGVVPITTRQDTTGPMTRSVADAALMLSVMAGHDPHDATSSHHAVPEMLAGLGGSVSGLRVGVAENYYFDGVDPEMADAVRAAIRRFEDLGARVETLALPDPASLVSVSNVIARAEAAAVHHRLLRERPHELGAAVRVRLGVGLGISATDYLQALRLRSRLTREFVAEVFARVDVLALPVIPEPAPAYAANEAGGVEAKVAKMGRFSRLTRPINGLGLPALSVPCGLSGDGRPLALQIVGRPFDEPTVLRLAHAHEGAGGFPRPSGV
jgi:Asp-tRNA(Asn)/Glu-tRNA(Gln) amidotransferase A subunit family amidase